MREFLNYIQKPSYKEKFGKIELQDFLSLVILYFGLMIPVGFLIFLLAKLTGIEMKAYETLSRDQILYGVLLAPLIEETLFRLIMVFNKRNLIILMLLVSSMTVFFVFKERYLKLVVFSFVLAGLFMCYLRQTRIKSLLTGHFNKLFYGMTILFALMHLFNYSGISINNFMLVSLFVVPQLLLGLILGYLRMSYGFAFAVLFHFVVNAPLLLRL